MMKARTNDVQILDVAQLSYYILTHLSQVNNCYDESKNDDNKSE